MEQQEPQLKKKNITITGLQIKKGETKDGRPWKLVSVYDQDNLKYSFFTKKTGDMPTKAYLALTGQKMTLGTKVGIAYKEEQREYQGKPYTARNIAFFEEPVAEVEEGVQPDPIEEMPIQDIPF